MSWLSDIAGKAENFLNAMDKSAASAISQATNVVQQGSIPNMNNSVLHHHNLHSSPNGSSKAASVSSRKHSFKSDFDFSNDAEYIET